MSSRIEYYGKSGQQLKYSVCKPDGTPKGAPLHPLPESQTSGYYTTISHTDLEKGDKVVIYGPENVLYDGEPLTYEGDFLVVDEVVGKGEFSAEAQALAVEQKDAGIKETSIKVRETKNGKILTGELLALALLVKHPEWPDNKIAKAVGVNRTTLYDWPTFKKAKKVLKQGKNHLPSGSKDGKTGGIEAWD